MAETSVPPRDTPKIDEMYDEIMPHSDLNYNRPLPIIPTTFHYFLELPREIRNIIYQILLVNGKIFLGRNTPRSVYSDFFKTHLGRNRIPPSFCQHGVRYRYMDHKLFRISITKGLLQGVSKAIQHEALEMFYSARNHFVLPEGYQLTVAGIGPPQSMEPTLPVNSLSIAFDIRQIDDTDSSEWKENMCRFLQQDSGINFDQLSRQERLNQVHEYRKERLQDRWVGNVNLIKLHLKMEFLQIDLEECYCPLGCCRLVDWICGLLGPFRKGFPGRFEVVGIKDKEEEVMIRERLSRLNDIDPSRITFAPWQHGIIGHLEGE